MENNIFFKVKKDKFNPDIEGLTNQKEKERIEVKFDRTKTIYNPITGIIPKNIKDANDLVIDNIKPTSILQINKMIKDKEKERKEQDIKLKPVKTKVINNNLSNNVETIEQTEVVVEKKQIVQRNYLQTHSDLKNGSVTNINSQGVVNKSNYNNILDNLKDLGIIN